MHYVKSKHKKVGVAKLIQDKIDSKIKSIPRDRKGYFIMIKMVNSSRRHSNMNVYVSNNRGFNNMKQISM